MAAMTLSASRSLAAARKLLSLARPPTAAAAVPPRSFSSMRFSVSDVTERYRSSDEDSDDDFPVPAVFRPIRRLERNLPMPCGGRGCFDVWDDEDGGFNVRLDMPGMDRKNVRVWVERKALNIRGDGPLWQRDSERGDIAAGRTYATKIVLPTREFKLTEIQAEVKLGVLRVVIPSAEENLPAVHVDVA